jgi:hypothetical protein
MKIFALILLLCGLEISAQDKVFFRDGTVREMQVISVTDDKVFVRENEGAVAYSLLKSDILLIDQASGRRYIFSEKGPLKRESSSSSVKRLVLGVQPFEALWGRATVVYEHMFLDGKVGVALPLSITYNTVKNPDYLIVDSVWAAGLKKVSFITGLDVNFYVGKKENRKFFIGPRFRYGTDITLENIEGFTLQSQLGWRFAKESGRVCQHLAFGFGFARILSTSLGPFPEPKQFFGWCSVTYRLSFRW